MPRLDEQISAQFAQWEQRARGWRVWPEPVCPEPPFEEFTGYALSIAQPIQDDGRKPGLLASLFDQVQQSLNPVPPVIVDEAPEPEPVETNTALDCEFAVSLPASLAVDDSVLRAFLDSLAVCSDATCFEVFAKNENLVFQFASSGSDASSLRRQLRAFFPGVVFIERQRFVSDSWNETEGTAFVVDFGLAHEFMLPLESDHRIDPFVDLIGALSALRNDELAVFQVLFQPARHSWGNSIWRSVTDTSGKNLFLNKPQLITGTKLKVAAPLFGVSIRAAAKAPEFDDAALILRNLAFSLRAFTRLEGNRLIPLHNEEYGFEEHEEDLLRRVSRRGGMLLNREELAAFVHFPSDEVQSPKLRRQRISAKAAPASVTTTSGVLLGFNEFAGRKSEVRLTSEQRVRHMHVIGGSGTGKSTLLFNLIKQDLENGQGVAVLDPHGDLVDRVLGVIPEERIDDVVLLDPSDDEYFVGFNILSTHTDFEKTLLASDLVSVFRRLCSSFGDQMASVLNNAILAFLESSRGGTLADLRRFLLDAEFRNEFLTTVRDPDIVFYWRKAFPQLGGNKSIGPVLTRLDMFLSPPRIRYIVSQQANRLDFSDILDNGKIFLAKLSKGLMGKENAFLLGSLLLAKLQQIALSRQRMEAAQRRDFFCYVDEFPDLMAPSIAEILAGTRKYRFGLVLAHQELRQLQRDPDIESAVMSNPGTRVVFHVGDADAHALEKGFASFTSRDIQSLGTGEAICRVERSDFDFNLSIPLPVTVDPARADERRARVTTRSREKYASPRADVEAALARGVPTDSRPEQKPVAPVEPLAPRLSEAAPIPEPAPTEKETPVVSKPLLPAEGIGGAQHQATQKRIKEAGEALGFFAVIEKQIPHGSIDVWLQKNGYAIACEISLTTTIDHEFRNVRKCLETECAHVAVVTSKRTRLDQIKQAVNAALAPEMTGRVGYYTPDEFIAFLQSLNLPPPITSLAQPTENIRRGRKVKVKVSPLTPEERKAKEELHLKAIAEAMRKRTR